MEEDLRKMAQSNNLSESGSYGFKNTFFDTIKQLGNEIYNRMSDNEKREYGRDWPYNTTNGSNNSNGNNYNHAGNEPPPKDPLIIDLGKKGIELTSLDDGVHFDLDKNGFAEKTAWIGSEDGAGSIPPRPRRPYLPDHKSLIAWCICTSRR